MVASLLQTASTSTSTRASCRSRFAPHSLVVIVAMFVALMGVVAADERSYIVIIDAGSSGSRVNVFSYDEDSVLTQEAFESFKPGVSHIAVDDTLGRGTLAEVIQYAQVVVPAEKRPDTPLYFLATAGMRLLPETEQTRILEIVRDMLQERSGFWFQREWASVMSGSDEAGAMWVSMMLQQQGPVDSLVMVDLGGASTQIGFVVQARSEATHRVTLQDGTTRSLFLYSRNGYGVTEAWNSFLSWTTERLRPRETVLSPCLWVNQTELAPSQSFATGSNEAVERCFAKTRLFVLRMESLRTLNNEATATPRLPSGATVFGVDNFAKYTSILLQAAHNLAEDRDDEQGILCRLLGTNVLNSTAMHSRILRLNWMQAAKCLEGRSIADIIEAVPAAPLEKVERLLFATGYMNAILETYKVPSGTKLEMAGDLGGKDQNWALGAAALRLPRLPVVLEFLQATAVTAHDDL